MINYDDSTDEDTAEAEKSGVRRSKRNNKGVTKHYEDYALMMNAQKQARGKKRATIKDGFAFTTSQKRTYKHLGVCRSLKVRYDLDY